MSLLKELCRLQFVSVMFFLCFYSYYGQVGSLPCSIRYSIMQEAEELGYTLRHGEQNGW